MHPADRLGIHLVKLAEAIRIIGSALGFFLAYGALETPASPDAIRILALTFALALCAPCAVEGLCLAKATAREKGYDQLGSGRIDPYQRQSALWFLAATVVAVAWALTAPEATAAFLLYVELIGGFFVLSALNHAWEAIGGGNRTWQNLNRPFLSLALVGGGVPILLAYR